jgi:hypothetical protein
MRKIYFVFLFLFLINSVQADISKLKFNGQVRYFSTLVDDLGTRYDDTRPGPALDLHFTYPVNEKLSIKNFNYVINYNDTTSGDETANIRYNQRLGLMYKIKGTVLYPYGKILHHDENPKKQIDSSHLGMVVQQYFSKDLFISADYREELSDGALVAGVRHSQRVFDFRINKKNFIKIKEKPVHLKIGYAEGVNLRGVKSIKFISEISDKLILNLKYVDNIGKGPIGSKNQDQNRDYLVSEIGYKF